MQVVIFPLCCPASLLYTARMSSPMARNSGGASWSQCLGRVGLGLAMTALSVEELQSPTLKTFETSGATVAEGDMMDFAGQRLPALSEVPELKNHLVSFREPGEPALREAPSSALERPVQPRLFFGGGPPNEEALQRFWRYAGGNDARVVVIGWGSTVSQEYYAKFSTALQQAVDKLALDARDEPQSIKLDIQKIPDLEELDGDFESALSLLREATGIFVLGGDQVRLMHALKATGADVLLRELGERDAIVQGGTSAGTAIGSRTMIGGYGSPPAEHSDQRFAEISLVRLNEQGEEESHPFFVGEGLGVVPEDVLIEQHLLRTGRVERLMRAVKSVPHIRWGVGIDDSMAAVWSGAGVITAVGPGRVLIVRKNVAGSVETVASLTNGESFDISEKRLVSTGS